MKKILLDTSAYSGLLTGEQNVFEALSVAETAYMSIFVLGELYAGFKGGHKERENKSILQKFLEKPTVRILNATAETAEIFAQIKNDLRKAGKPIPINDVWIAAHTLETGSLLITFDTHFKSIPSLRIWDSIAQH
jgi:tRNA(fMet)-specific endonuclease VapC